MLDSRTEIRLQHKQLGLADDHVHAGGLLAVSAAPLDNVLVQGPGAGLAEKDIPSIQNDRVEVEPEETAMDTLVENPFRRERDARADRLGKVSVNRSGQLPTDPGEPRCNPFGANSR